MAHTKAVDPRMMPRRLTMLTCTMYKHLHIPELIPIATGSMSILGYIMSTFLE